MNKSVQHINEYTHRRTNLVKIVFNRRCWTLRKHRKTHRPGRGGEKAMKEEEKNKQFIEIFAYYGIEMVGDRLSLSVHNVDGREARRKRSPERLKT